MSWLPVLILCLFGACVIIYGLIRIVRALRKSVEKSEPVDSTILCIDCKHVNKNEKPGSSFYWQCNAEEFESICYTTGEKSMMKAHCFRKNCDGHCEDFEEMKPADDWNDHFKGEPK